VTGGGTADRGVRLAELVAVLPGARATGDVEGALVRGASLDSRAVRAGELYAALPGARAHGADFTAAAVAAGASCVLTDPEGARRAGSPGVPVVVVEDPRAVLGDLAARVHGTGVHAGRAGEDAPGAGAGPVLLGVTGTNGKTTTAYLLEGALSALGRTTGLVGTVETRVAGEVLASTRTTPEATDLHALLARMARAGVEVAALEVSSHALALHRVDGVVVDVAAFTNLSQDHLDFHADLEDYFAVKASLFTPERARRGVVVVDDAWGRRLAATAGVPVVTVATAPGQRADWTAQDLVAEETGTSFVLAGPGGRRLELRAPLPGAFNVANTALAAVVLLEAAPLLPGGTTAGAVAAALARAGAVPGRLEVVAPPPRTGTGTPGRAGAGDRLPRVLVDYAHTPDAVAAALAAVRPSTTGRLVVVLGAGGDRDRGKRGPMGVAAARHADVVVVTDDNPRSEDPARVRAAVLAGATAPGAAPGPSPVDPAGRAAPRDPAAQVLEVADRAGAIRAALDAAGPGGTVLVAGKGHERGQEVAGVVHPFDDRDEVRAALALAALAEAAPDESESA